MGFNMPQKIGDSYWLAQKTRAMKLIESECCEWFAIYGRPELIFFNYYRHWSSLVLQNSNRTASFMHSR